MRRQNKSFGDALLKAPWWFSVALGFVIFAGVHYGLPIWAGEDNTRQIICKAVVPLAPLALFFFGAFAFASYLFNQRNRRLVDDQTGLESLRKTSWKDFEYLIAEAYRRQGFQVEYSLRRGADGGVDLVLRKSGQTSFVQCKQWKASSVGASVVREMFGLMVAQRAHEIIIVTSGHFTRDAIRFAEGKPIRLVDGLALLALVQSVQIRHNDFSPNAETMTDSPSTPVCPNCGKSMVLRTAKRGSNAGNQFWGCSGFPVCKVTREFRAHQP
jgi:restriction system protein